MGDPRQPVHQWRPRQRPARADGDRQGRRRRGDRDVRAPLPRRSHGPGPRPRARVRRHLDLHPPDRRVQRGLRPREAGRPDLGVDRREKTRRPRPRVQEQGFRDSGPGGQGAHLRRRPRHRARQGHGPDLRVPAGRPRLPAPRGRGRAAALGLALRVGQASDRRRRRSVLADHRGHGRAAEGGGAHFGRAGRRALRGRRVHPHAADPLRDVRAPLEPRRGHRRDLHRFAAARRDVLGPGPRPADGAGQLRRRRDRAGPAPRARP